MSRVTKLYGCATFRKMLINNTIAVHKTRIRDLKYLMDKTTHAETLRQLSSAWDDYETVIEDAQQELADIAAESQRISNVQEVPVNDFIWGVR